MLGRWKLTLLGLGAVILLVLVGGVSLSFVTRNSQSSLDSFNPKVDGVYTAEAEIRNTDTAEVEVVTEAVRFFSNRTLCRWYFPKADGIEVQQMMERLQPGADHPSAEGDTVCGEWDNDGFTYESPAGTVRIQVVEIVSDGFEAAPDLKQKTEAATNYRFHSQ